jgi:rare lipoprotein A
MFLPDCSQIRSDINNYTEVYALKKFMIACLSIGISLVVSPTMAQSWSGKASYYKLGGRTASGGRVGHMTAAHRSLPFGTRVKVTNLGNGRSAVVTINDRGPFVRGRVIDISAGAADVLGMRHSGVARVRVDTI